MYCTACGTRNALESNYCKQCGRHLEKNTPVRITQEEFDRDLPDDEQATALLERAYEARKSGDLAEAIRLCDAAITLRSESTSAHSLLGQLYEQAGDRPAAINEFERVLQLNPGSIADHVKLDELKGADILHARNRGNAPQIVLVDRNAARANGHMILAAAGIIGILCIVSGALALAWHSVSHETERPARADSAVRSVAQATNPPTQETANQPGAPASTGAAGAAQAPVPGFGNAYYPPYTYYPPPSYPQPQTRTVYIQSPGTRTNRRGNLPPLAPRPANRQDSMDDSGDHVRLSTDGDGGQYTVNVGANDGPTIHVDSTPKPDKKLKSPASPPDMIKIHTHGDDTGAGAAAPGEDARAMLAIASEKNQQQDYRGAVTALRKALQSAGDQTGYVYLQMGICYQHLQDKSNALNAFNNARAEYQKLVDSKQQVETARASIKICENGIKQCTSE